MLSWLIAILSTVLCLFLWFRDVRRIMLGRRSTVESAAGQLTACRKKFAKAQGDPEVTAVLERSQNIYRQSVVIYNQTIRKPWIYLPAYLMGFRPATAEEAERLQTLLKREAENRKKE